MEAKAIGSACSALCSHRAQEIMELRQGRLPGTQICHALGGMCLATLNPAFRGCCRWGACIRNMSSFFRIAVPFREGQTVEQTTTCGDSLAEVAVAVLAAFVMFGGRPGRRWRAVEKAVAVVAVAVKANMFGLCHCLNSGGASCGGAISERVSCAIYPQRLQTKVRNSEFAGGDLW